MLDRILFNLSHWCLDYDEYLREYNQIDKLPSGHMEKTFLKAFFDNPPKGIKKQEVRTSGSTGTPVRFWCNSGRIASSLALVDYRFKQLGLRPDDVFMKFWYPTTGHTKIQLLKEWLYRKITGEKFFSYFDFINGKKTATDFIDFVNKHEPDFLEGYAGGIIALASFIVDSDININPIRVIVTGAGMVTPAQHKLIEKAFHCKHYDRYGCSEFGEIAHQLGNGFYEPNPHLIIEVSKDFEKFELLENAKDGEYEIFITDPRNICTPFRRYRMKDTVKVKGGKLVAILGRTEKAYEISPGRFLPTGFFYQAVKDFGVDQWQVEVSGQDNEITLRTLPRELNEKEKRAFEKYFGDTKFVFHYERGNFTTIGDRKKIQEVIVR